jgi:hypothetical protein
MSEQNVQIVVDGTLVEGAAPEQVKQRVAQLFKTTVDKVEPMFSGKPFAVKKGLDLETARKYQAALKQAGLVAKLTAESALQNATLAPTGSDIDATPEPPPANIDTSDLSMAAAGETIMKHAAIQKPEIDTSRYQVEQRGQTLDQQPRPAAPKIDTSELSVASVGEDVMEYLPIPEVDIDTSELSVAEAGITIMEHKPVPPAQIDTSKIKLAE